MAIFGSLYLSYIGDYALLFFPFFFFHSLSPSLSRSLLCFPHCAVWRRGDKKGHDSLTGTSKMDLKATKDGAERRLIFVLFSAERRSETI